MMPEVGCWGAKGTFRGGAVVEGDNSLLGSI